MNIIIAGSRTFKHNQEVFDWLVETLEVIKPDNIICGMAKGADLFGKSIAEYLEINVIECPADWDNYGKKAGFLRNLEMAGLADKCILLTEGSKGTEQMRQICMDQSIKVIQYTP